MRQYRRAIAMVVSRVHARKDRPHSPGTGAISRLDGKWSFRRCLLVGVVATVVGWALIASLIMVLL